MTETSPGILIIGGGVAGLSAALALKPQDVAVHLVEKSDRLGGNAAAWACMATTTCQNCGACLVREMAAEARRQANLTIHLDTTVASVVRNGARLTATLSSGQSVDCAKAVLATGFTPFDPGAVPSLHTRDLPRVITTATLNTWIREETVFSAMGSAPRIAFLQCIGSRNPKEGRDYCSQVCCKISMRHAQKLLHLLPDAQITLFYMDLQIMGKEARTAFQALQGQVELVQGVPAEILPNPSTGALTLVVEDSAARSSREFDLVVLSVGMTPDSTAGETFGKFGITPNAWGFFNTDEATLQSDVIVAGCAQGPKDILSARQDGRIAAAEALRAVRYRKEISYPGVAVLGDGHTALTAATAAAAAGYPVYTFGPPPLGQPRGIQALGNTRIISVEGVTGRFSIRHEADGQTSRITCGAVIAAPEPELSKAALQGDIPLEDLSSWPSEAGALTESAPKNERVLLLLDTFGPENKASSRQALLSAVAARKAGREVFILMNKMLVHGPEGQTLYDRARTSGIRFLRYKTPSDVTFQTAESGITVTLDEATLPGHRLSLTVDRIAAAGAVRPAPGFRRLTELLKQDLDREGFLQSANVRHRRVQSPRRGIYFIGPCHDETDDKDLESEIRAVLADLELRARDPGSEAPAVSINEKKCAKCLTCYRVCPHGAIVLNEKSRPQIMPDACFYCLACVSNCPAYAIETQGFDNADLAGKAARGRTLVLACERSAALAADRRPAGTDLVSIPCACRISSDILLAALVKGASRVIVSGCHDGNCRSGDGALTARHHVERLLALPGLPRGKICFQPVAANEPQTFARMISSDAP